MCGFSYCMLMASENVSSYIYKRKPMWDKSGDKKTPKPYPILLSG